MKRVRLAGGILAATALLGLMGWQVRGFWRDREVLRGEVEKLESAAANFKISADAEAMLRQREEALLATTLGGTAEVVDARLRAGVNQILSACGVVEPVVSAQTAEGVRHPATKAAELAGLQSAELLSFATLTARAQGRGSYEQVLAAVATIASQAWSHRIDQVAITPVGKNRSQYDMEVVVTTLFVPGRAAAHEDDDAQEGVMWVGLDDAAQARLTRLVRSNPFVDPAPVAVADVPAPPSAPPAPVGPAYDQWRITALVQGREGVELWLQRIGSGERRALRSGETILDARFEGTRAGEAALLRIGGKVFEVALGRTLADRVEVSQ